MNHRFQLWSPGRLSLSVWEYAGELILTALICVFLLMWLDVKDAHQRLCALRTDLLAIVGATIGLNVAIWVGFITILSSKFGSWLRKRGQASAYSQAFATPAICNALAFLLLLFTICNPTRYIVMLNMFVLIYGFVNFVTMIRNLHGLVRLWQTWPDFDQ